VALPDPLWHALILCVRAAEGVTVPTTEAEAEPLTVAVPHEVADAEGERLAVSLAVGVCDEDSDCVSEVDTEEDGVRAAEPLA